MSRNIIIIIGAARSGTKLLRDLLGAAEGVAAIPFDVNYIWRAGNESLADDVIPEQAATIARAAMISSMLETMAIKANGPGFTMIVEKTVSNAFRIPFIRTLFPDARFVHLIRDGRDVAESAARMWRAPTDLGYTLRKLRFFPMRNFRYAWWFLKNTLAGTRGTRIWGPRYPGIHDDLDRLSIIEIAARQWAMSVEAALSGLECVPASNRIEVRYEDLVKDEQSIMKIMEFCGIHDHESVKAAYADSVRSDLGGKWRTLEPADQVRVVSIEADTLKKLSYLE